MSHVNTLPTNKKVFAIAQRKRNKLTSDNHHTSGENLLVVRFGRYLNTPTRTNEKKQQELSEMALTKKERKKGGILFITLPKPTLVMHVIVK